MRIAMRIKTEEADKMHFRRRLEEALGINLRGRRSGYVSVQGCQDAHPGRVHRSDQGALRV